MVNYKRSFIKRPEDIWTLYIPSLDAEINSSSLYSQSDIDDVLMPWKAIRDSFSGYISSDFILDVENNHITVVTILDDLARAIEFHDMFYSSNSIVPEIVAMRNLVMRIAQDHLTVYTVESLVSDVDELVLHVF